MFSLLMRDASNECSQYMEKKKYLTVQSSYLPTSPLRQYLAFQTAHRNCQNEIQFRDSDCH